MDGGDRVRAGAVTSDRRLVRTFLRRRTEAAFREIYGRHTPVLYRTAWRLTGGVQQDAEEIVQEAWIRAIQALPRFRWGSSLKTWLVGIVLNLCRERSRERTPAGSRESFDEREGASAGPAEDRIDIEQAIARLPGRYREVIVLHEIEGYTHKEIGRLLGIDEGTSKSQLHHARQAMRGRLAPQGGST